MYVPMRASLLMPRVGFDVESHPRSMADLVLPPHQWQSGCKSVRSRDSLGASLRLATLHLPGFGTVDVVSGNPVGVVCGGRGNGRAGGLLHDFALSRDLLLAGLACLALLGEVRRNPNGIEEVDNANEAGQEEEVKEDAALIVSKARHETLTNETGAAGEGKGCSSAYIWGSKMLVSGSTTLTVPLKAWRVKKWPSLSDMMAAMLRRRSTGCISVAKL